MSQTLAVAARELRERWLLFPGGLALGVVPLILPAFGLPAEAPPTVGLLVAVLLGTISAVVIGSSMLARDAADGRLGFLFSRPVPWAAVWGGKWLAAIILVTGSAGLAALPWMLTYPPHPDSRAGSWGAALLDPQGATFFALLLLLGVGLANFGATVFRSRSAWLALDLGFLLAAAWLAWRWAAPLYRLQLFGQPWAPMAGWALLLPLVPVAAGLFLASAAQVVLGRTDLRRAHRALSLVFWAVIFASLGAAGLRLAWARAATPADLEQYVSGAYDPSGRWLYTKGLSRRGGGIAFLIDTEENRYVPMGLDRLGERRLLGMTFAADGRSGVLLVDGPEFAGILSVELGGDEPRFTGGELEKSPRPDFGTKLALSPTGAYVLLAHEHGASLFAVPSGRRVATATIPPGWRPAAGRLVEESVGRVWLVPSVGAPVPSAVSEMRVLEVAPDREPRMKSVPLAVAVNPAHAWPDLVHPDAAGRRVLTRDGGLRLREGATGALVATLVEGHSAAPVPYLGRSPDGFFLTDGRIVVGEATGARTVLRVFDQDGVPLDEISLDRIPVGLVVGPEVAPGRVAVRFTSGVGPETVVIDLAEGRVVETLTAQPLFGFWWLGAPRVSSMPVHFLVRSEDGAIVRRDFATGEQRVVAGPGAPAGERLDLR